MSAPTVDIGILTIRDDEFRAALLAFPGGDEIHRGRHREYAIRTADASRSERYTIAILRQIEQGNGEAQEAARDLIDDLEPSLLLVVGIAGGLPSDDITLGDVVLSTRIIDFSIEARKFREEATYNVGGGPIAKSIASGIANLSARESELGTWWDELPTKPKVNVSSRNQFYGPKNWQQNARKALELHFGALAVARPPAFAAGPIASSDRLIKDPKLLIPWITTARGILGIEMESAGVHRATRDKTPMLAIRSISDIVGIKRHDAWTKYACLSAAYFARAYLRTGPVPRRIAGRKVPGSNEPVKVPVRASANALPLTQFDEAFANLLPLRHFPEVIYIAPALCKTMKQGWAQLRGSRRKATDEYIPASWTLYEKNIYSFSDPEVSRLRKLADVGGLDQFDSRSWAFSDDDDKRRLFVYLLNAALREDLWGQGVRWHGDQEVFAFMGGYGKEPPRKLKYANLKLRSTATVVSHYESTSEKGKQYKYFRHTAFQGRFRLLGGQWYLEVTPTYRFTYNGKELDRFHDKRLSGIKRIERNRSVLSQLLIWQATLRAPWSPLDRARSLEFAPLVNFQYDSDIDESRLTALDAPALPVSSGDVELDS